MKASRSYFGLLQERNASFGVDLMVKTVKLTLDDWQRQTINHAIALLYERWTKTAPDERGTKDLKNLMVKLTQAGVY